MYTYYNEEVLKRRKRRFKIWLKERPSADREALQKIAFTDLMEKNGIKTIKYTDLTSRMFEMYEDSLAGKCPPLKAYFEKKYPRRK